MRPGPKALRARAAVMLLKKVTQKFEEARRKVKPATLAIISTLRELSDSPDETSVEFGVKLSAKAGVVIASADTEANLVFKLTVAFIGCEGLLSPYIAQPRYPSFFSDAATISSMSL